MGKNETNQANFTYNNFLKPKVVVKMIYYLYRMFDQILLLLEVYCYLKFSLHYHFYRASTYIYMWQVEMKILYFIDTCC